MKKIIYLILPLCLAIPLKSTGAINLIINGGVVPTSMFQGLTYSVSYTVQNTGSTSTSTGFYVSVFISPNSIFSSGTATYLTDIYVAGGIAGNSTKTVSGQITIPSAYSTGVKYIIAGADGTNIIPESNEGDNNFPLSILLKTCPLATPSSLTPGGPLSSPTIISTLTPVLQWGAVPNATCYGVYIRNVVTNVLIYNNDAATTTNSFTVPSGLLSEGGQYKWNCLAKSDCSNSGCLSAGATTVYFNVNCPLPASPTGLTATPFSSSQINISWNSLSGANLYEVTYASGTCPWAATGSLIQTTSNSASITGLNSNTAYRFVVSARNSCGWGTISNCISATTTGSCTYSISPSSISPSSPSGNGSVSVNASVGCNWTAVSNNTSWLTVTSGSNGTGNGTINYSYTVNSSPSSRTGTITIAGNTFTVIQAGTGCTYSISPFSVSPSSSAGNGSVAVSATAGCAWTATSNNTSWLTVISGSSGNGNGTVNYSCTANTSPSSRIGTITIAGYTFTVTQDGTVPPPTVNSLICTNIILNHQGITPSYTFYTDNSPYSNNDPIKVCADGSTATYFKVNVSNTSGIGFRILDENNNSINDIDKYGQLGAINVFGNNVEIPYTHPQYMDANSLYRSLTLQVTFNGSPISGLTFPLTIYRAPVLMIHGWLGGLSSFEAMEYSFLQNNYIWPLTYRKIYPNSASFNDNINVAPDGIIDLLNRVRSGNISCGKIDIIAHSMGGLLSRLYLQSNSYKNDIHKLITLNTPHSGTQGANFVYDIGIVACPLIGWTSLGDFLCTPAIENMRVNSNSIRNQLNGYSLNHHVVPSYSITTQDIFATDPDCNSLGVILYTGPEGLVNFILLQSIFNFEGNDLVVPKSSQQGGLTKFHHFNGQCHLKSTRNQEIILHTIETLNAAPNGNNFDIDGYSPATLNSIYRSTTQSTSLSQSLLGNISIISPTNGDSFNPGQQILIQTSGTPSISKTLITAGNEAIPIFARDTLSSSVSMNYTIPFEAVGEVRIACAGYDSINQSFAIDTIRIKITDNALLDSIGTHLDTLRIPLGTQSLLPVIAYYHDNSTREISRSDSISFIVNDTTISKNLFKNIFFAQSSGITMLQINYRNKSIEVPILVYQRESAVSTIFSSDKRIICTNDSVNFSDISIGGALSRQWLFEGGVPNTSTDINPVIIYPYAGVYKVKLTSTFISGVDSLVIDSLIEVKTLNRTISSGNWNNPSTWSCNTIPSANDSAVIASGHAVTLNNSSQVRKLNIEDGGSISLNDSTVTFTIGSSYDKISPVICDGSMVISKGNLKIYGNLSLSNTSRYNMTGGKLIIDGNTGQASTSIPDGQHLFNVACSINSFNLKVGTLQFINPPLGANSQAINCPYNLGLLSTVVFGDGASTIASNNPNGFGGNLLPSLIGKLVFDPATDSNNRIFRNTNPLTANKDIKILSGNFAPGVLFKVIDSIPSLTDVDGNSYPIITICEREWLGKNLAVTHYRNGDTIPQVQDPTAWAALTTGAWCYYQNNTANGPVYGKLYNWYAVNDPRGLAPLGWHIPTNEEWMSLADTCLGGTATAGGKMKTTGLLSNNTGLWGGIFNNSTNSSGFSGIPAGYRTHSGTFQNLSGAAYWWSATSNTTSNASYREADQEDDNLHSGATNKKLGLSVRCVKD